MPRGLRWACAAIALALLVVFPLIVTKPFPRHVMISIFLYAMLAQAWNLLAGYCGQISLGHASFFRTGAYIYATTGKAPSSMDPALLQAAFRKKG